MHLAGTNWGCAGSRIRMNLKERIHRSGRQNVHSYSPLRALPPSVAQRPRRVFNHNVGGRLQQGNDHVRRLGRHSVSLGFHQSSAHALRRPPSGTAHGDSCRGRRDRIGFRRPLLREVGHVRAAVHRIQFGSDRPLSVAWRRRPSHWRQLGGSLRLGCKRPRPNRRSDCSRRCGCSRGVPEEDRMAVHLRHQLGRRRHRSNHPAVGRG